MRQKGSDDLNDSEIIDLFYMRSERAIMELAAKYGNVCNKVAKNILNNILDAEECVNDAATITLTNLLQIRVIMLVNQIGMTK